MGIEKGMRVRGGGAIPESCVLGPNHLTMGDSEGTGNHVQ